MGLKAAILGLAFSISFFAYSEANGANEAMGRNPSTGPASRDAALRALYSNDNALWWSGNPKAEVRRTALLHLLERERKLDPSITSESPPFDARFEFVDRASVVRADRWLTPVWLGYLSRRRGFDDSVPFEAALRAIALLEQAESANELRLAALEFVIVQTVGGWLPVGATLESLPEPTLLEASEITRNRPQRDGAWSSIRPGFSAAWSNRWICRPGTSISHRLVPC